MAKKRRRHRYWFRPIGLRNGYFGRAHPIWKSDYPIWLAFAALAFLYWFGGYFVVNAIILAQFNQATALAAQHGGIAFSWDPDKIIMNGDRGGFNAVFADGTQLPGGATSLMPFVMRQTNVTFYLFNVMNNTVNGTNLENANTPFLAFPDPADPVLAALAQNKTNLDFKDPAAQYYVNRILDAQNGILSPQNARYVAAQMALWLHSFAYSNLMFTPLCQFLSFAFPLSIILSYKKDVASLFAPWAFLGGFITIYGGIVADENIHVTWQLIFFDQQMFFGYHAFLMIAGLCWMVYCGRCGLARLLYTYAVIASYIFYVGVASAVFGIHYFTTGMTRLDFSIGGSYIIVSLVLADSSIAFPGTTALMFFVFTALINAVIALKNLIHSRYWKRQIGRCDETFSNDVRLAARAIRAKWRRLAKHG